MGRRPVVGEGADLRRPRRGARGGVFDRRASGLNHLAFHAASRDRVDAITDGVRGRVDSRILYDDQHPFAGDYYTLYCLDPEGIKVKVVGPEA